MEEPSCLGRWLYTQTPLPSYKYLFLGCTIVPGSRLLIHPNLRYPLFAMLQYPRGRPRTFRTLGRPRAAVCRLIYRPHHGRRTPRPASRVDTRLTTTHSSTTSRDSQSVGYRRGASTGVSPPNTCPTSFPHGCSAQGAAAVRRSVETGRCHPLNTLPNSSLIRLVDGPQYVFRIQESCRYALLATGPESYVLIYLSTSLVLACSPRDGHYMGRSR